MVQHVGEAVHVPLEVHDRRLVRTLYNWATVHKPKTISHEGLLLTRDRENCGSVRACIYLLKRDFHFSFSAAFSLATPLTNLIQEKAVVLE